MVLLIANTRYISIKVLLQIYYLQYVAIIILSLFTDKNDSFFVIKLRNSNEI